MDRVQAPLLSNSAFLNLKSASAPADLSNQDLTVTRSSGKINISAEAQYLFEMDKYLSELDQVEQGKALDYLSESEDPLLKGVSDYFRKMKTMLDQSMGQDRSLSLDRTESEKLRNLLNVDFELNGSTEIGVIPLATKVFRLDGNENFYPVKLDARNYAAESHLEKLERSTAGMLGNQDSANLFGSIRNTLSASENILLSFDDVFHFNYSVEKSRTAIDTIDAPENVISELAKLLNQSIDYQNAKQTQFLRDAEGLLTNDRVGGIASEDIRLGTAAQKFNHQLQDGLTAENSSILSARPLVDQLLSQHTDLIRFGEDKVDEAFGFYEDDFSAFNKALNKDFSPTVEIKEFRIGGEFLEEGKKLAANLIREVDNHLDH